jgi:protein-L-isoaspartate(D-aspartate) O-methyltransferase
MIHGDRVLARAARRRLAVLGYERVHLPTADGRKGWAEHAPFQAILSTAATLAVPARWIEQLATEGRLLAPIGRPGEFQVLPRFVERPDGQLVAKPLLPVRFVPLRE